MQGLTLLKNKMNQKNSAAKKVKKEKEEPKLVRDDADHSIPDRSHGDLYCSICDSHMNSDAMWQAHIIGKKHIKNINKEGGPEKKYEILQQPCSIQKELDEITEDAVVGLKHIDEIYRKNASGPIFMCYLCHSNLSMGSLLIEHILSYKHRLAYLKENDPQRYNTVNIGNFSKGGMESLLYDIAHDLEGRFGRGTITVKKEIEKQEVLQTWSAKKAPKPQPLPPLTPPIESYPHDLQARSFGEFLSRSEMNAASNYRRSVSPFGQQLRSTSSQRYRNYTPSPPRRYIGRSPSPPRKYRERSPSPPRRYRERSRTPPRRYRERSPSPSPRYRERSHSPLRKRREPSPAIKMRNREKKTKHSEKSRKKRQTRSPSSSSSSSSSQREHSHAHRSVEESQSHSCQTEIRSPSFNVLHRSPVQHSLAPATSSNSTIFMSTGDKPTNSASQVFYNNGNHLNNPFEGAVNAPVTNGTIYENEYAPRHMRLDNMILKNAQRNIPGLEVGYSHDELRRMASSLSNDDFVNMVYEKLDQLPYTAESNFLMEQLHFKIGQILNSRRQSMQIRQNVYAATSISSNAAASNPRVPITDPIRNIMMRSTQPLDEFLAMARRKMEQ